MTDYSKITALYSRLSVGDEDRDGGESNSIQNQKIFLENYARGQHLTNIRHYIDDDESGRFFDRSAYSRMMDDVENGKIGVCIMKDLTRWGRDYLQVGNAMEIFRRNNVRFIAVNNGIDSEKPDTLEFAPFINIMSEWYAKDISKKVKTGIKTKGMSGKPIVTEAPYGYVKDPDNKDFWIIDEEAAEVVRLIFRLFIGGKNRNQIAVYLTQEQIPTPTFYMKDRGRGTCKNKTLNEDNRCKWNKVTLTNTKTILEDLCGEGALEFLTRVQSREYDESRAVLATYLYPHLKGRMTRWLEQHIGNLSLSKHEMDAVRQAQRLYHSGQFSIEEIAEKMDVLLEQAVKHIRYNTHFVGVNDLIPGSYDGDPFERLMPGNLSVSAEQVVYRKVCIELLQELFDALPKKDRDILGKFYGVFGFEKTSLKEIGMYHMMKESAVEKAKERAVTKLKKAYPGSRLQIWRNVHRMIRRPILPAKDDRALRRSFTTSTLRNQESGRS